MSKERLYGHIQVKTEVVRGIFKAFKENTEVIGLDLITEGMSTTNYVVTLKENKRYLLKIYPKNGSSMKKEMESYRYGESSTMVPKILYFDDSMKIIEYGYLIMEYIEGKTLKKFLIHNKGFQDGMMYSIGRNLALLHRRVYSKRGLLDYKLALREELPTIKSSLEKVLGEYAGKHLGEEIKAKTEEYIHKNSSGLKQLEEHYVYAHGDFNLSNILIDREYNVYFIDFEYSLSESPYLDIGKFFRSREETDIYMTKEAKAEFFSGYNSISDMLLKSNWERLSELREVLSLLGFINTEKPPRSWIESIKAEVQRVISKC